MSTERERSGSNGYFKTSPSSEPNAARPGIVECSKRCAISVVDDDVLAIGRDLLGEDLVARDAVRSQGIELGLEFLGEVGTTGVADADVRARRVRDGGRWRRGARPPRLARTAVGRDGHALLVKGYDHAAHGLAPSAGTGLA